jgi:hypothetical protein
MDVHVIPGMDATAANSLAAMILGGGRKASEEAVNESIVHGSVHTDSTEAPEMTSSFRRVEAAT